MLQYLQKLELEVQRLYLPGKHLANPSARFVVQPLGSVVQPKVGSPPATEVLPVGQVLQPLMATSQVSWYLPAGQL